MNEVSLFDSLALQLWEEMASQLSAPALTVLNALGNNLNAIYNISSITDAVSNRDLAIIRQTYDLYKRFIGDSKKAVPKEERDQACWLKFYEANQSCAKQNVNFADLPQGIMHALEYARNRVSDAFWAHAETDDFEFLWDKDNLIPISGFSTGPGSCTGVKGTSVLQKYRSDWSVSSDMGERYLLLLRKLSKPLATLPFFNVVKRNAVSAVLVAKDADTSRLVVPQLNGDLYLQYPASSCLSNMLKSTFHIDIETQQDKNRELARKGSLYDNWDIYDRSPKRRAFRPCTIDLSSASDLWGTEIVKFLTPIPLFNYMDMCRSTRVEGPDGTDWNLAMMANMGNAYCFPMQTILFASLVEAVYFQLGIKGTPYGVYGDDIIVDVTAYDYMITLLESLGMKPNQKKCFSMGFFRESCGGDYFRGYDIRPVFCQELSDDSDIYNFTNRLIDWGARHSVNVSSSVALLLSNVKVKTVVPMDCGPHQGLKVPALYLPLLPSGWTAKIKYRVKRDMVDIPRVYGVPNDFRRDFKRTMSQNVYTEIEYFEFDKTIRHTCIRLSRKEQSLFPFLRGGISHASKLDKQLVKVVMRGQDETNNSSLSDHLETSATARVVPYWSSGESYFPVSLASSMEAVNNYYVRCFDIVFQRHLNWSVT